MVNLWALMVLMVLMRTCVFSRTAGRAGHELEVGLPENTLHFCRFDDIALSHFYKSKLFVPYLTAR
jgi:hypothetical protein